MRKRSAYRPRPVMLDPVGFVVAGLRPVSAATETMTVVGLKNHGSVKAVQSGQATRDDVQHLVNALNVATALAHMGQGADWLPELASAQQAIKAASQRQRFLFTGPELTAVNTAIDVHDAQMADQSTTVQMLERAISGLNHLAAIGKTTKLDMKNIVAFSS